MAHNWLYLEPLVREPSSLKHWHVSERGIWVVLGLSHLSNLERILWRIFKELSPIALRVFLLTLPYVGRKNCSYTVCHSLRLWCSWWFVPFSWWSRGDIVEPGWASWTHHRCRCHQQGARPNMVRSFCQKYITTKVHQKLGLLLILCENNGILLFKFTLVCKYLLL